MKKKSVNFSHLSDTSLTSTLANPHAMEKKVGDEMETSLSEAAKAKKPPKKYFAANRFNDSRQGEPGDYSAYLEKVEEGNESAKEGTLKGGLSRYLHLKGRNAKKEEDREGEGSADGAGIGAQHI